MNINSISGIENNSIGIKEKTNNNNSFTDILKDAVNLANETAKSNEADTVNLLTGEVNDLHSSMIEAEKAELALQFTMQIRNKMLDAYNEIMRLQI